MLVTVHPTLNDHEYNMRPTCVIHVVWRHFILVPSTSFSQVLWSVLWLRHQFVTDVTAWLINPNLSCSKNKKLKEKKTENKIQEKEKIKTESTIHDFDTIVLYGFQLWFYNKAPLSYPLKELKKIQRRAAIWILGIFHTLPSLSIEAITSLIPFHLYLCKLSGRA